MKKIMLTVSISLISLVSASEISSVMETQSTEENKPSFSMQISGSSGSLTGSSSGTNLDMKGIDFSVGKTFSLKSYLETMTSLGVRTLNVKGGQLGAEITNYNLFDVNISQKLSYVSSVAKFTLIKPFVAGGIGLGNREYHYQGDDSGGRKINGSYNTRYTTFNYSAGVDFQFPNGLTPFFQYQVSTLRFSDKTEFSGTIDGNTGDTDFTANNERFKSESFMLGLGYFF